MSASGQRTAMLPARTNSQLGWVTVGSTRMIGLTGCPFSTRMNGQARTTRSIRFLASGMRPSRTAISTALTASADGDLGMPWSLMQEARYEYLRSATSARNGSRSAYDTFLGPGLSMTSTNSRCELSRTRTGSRPRALLRYAVALRGPLTELAPSASARTTTSALKARRSSSSATEPRMLLHGLQVLVITVPPRAAIGTCSAVSSSVLKQMGQQGKWSGCTATARDFSRPRKTNAPWYVRVSPVALARTTEFGMVARPRFLLAIRMSLLARRQGRTGPRHPPAARLDGQAGAVAQILPHRQLSH